MMVHKYLNCHYKCFCILRIKISTLVDHTKRIALQYTDLEHICSVGAEMECPAATTSASFSELMFMSVCLGA